MIPAKRRHRPCTQTLSIVPLELGQHSFDSRDPRRVLRPLVRNEFLAARTLEADEPDHGWKQRTLADQRHDDDGKGRKENEIAVGEWPACCHQGDGKRRRQADRPPQADEAHHEWQSPVRVGVHAAQGGYEEARQIGRRKDPHEADHDHCDAHHGRDRQRLGEIAFEAVDDGLGLQTRQQEDQRLGCPGEQVPEEISLQPRGRPDEAAPVPRHVESGDDAADHARTAEAMGWPECDEGRRQRQQDLRARIIGGVAQAQHHPADRQSKGDLAHDDEDELRSRLGQREGAGRNCRQRKAEHDQGRGIVYEALAFQNGQQPLRQHQIARDRERRHGIGWRDDRSEHEADRHGKAEQIVGHEGNARRRSHDAADGQQKDRPQVCAEAQPAHIHAGRIEQRRQQDHQDDLRLQLEPGHARQVGYGNAGCQHENGRGDRNPAADGAEAGDRNHQQQGQQQCRSIHGPSGASLAGPGSGGSRH